MNSGHETFNNFKIVMDDLSKGSKAVGCARGVRHNLEGWVVSIQVDTNHKHGGVCTRSRDDYFLGSSFNMSLFTLTLLENIFM